MYSVWYSCTWFLKSDNSIRQSYCRRRAINFLQSRRRLPQLRMYFISSPCSRSSNVEVNRNFHFRISLHRNFLHPGYCTVQVGAVVRDLSQYMVTEKKLDHNIKYTDLRTYGQFALPCLTGHIQQVDFGHLSAAAVEKSTPFYTFLML